ncbi:MAG: lipopolysaccharide export system ATP-binding protein [Planctomycetota bacterium]|jgi:lipopolysaccharide export system ATP-binding protein
MLESKSLSKKYKGRLAVDSVSLSVKKGEVVGLLGPNGAGKTTTFYMIVGLIPCDSGQILLDGQDVSKRSMHYRARQGLGYLPQEASVFRRLNVRKNIMAALELRSDLNGQGRRSELERLVDALAIGHLLSHKAMALSGGERRRVEIARALASNPSFVLLDEPFAGVDPIAVGEIREVVRHLTDRGIGVLVTDHNVRETLQICDRAYILNDGKMLTSGNPAAILANDKVREVYLGRDFSM